MCFYGGLKLTVVDILVGNGKRSRNTLGFLVFVGASSCGGAKLTTLSPSGKDLINTDVYTPVTSSMLGDLAPGQEWVIGLGWHNQTSQGFKTGIERIDSSLPVRSVLLVLVISEAHLGSCPLCHNGSLPNEPLCFGWDYLNSTR
jgi:hypothetical protein